MVKTYAVNCNDAWLQTPGDDLNGSYVKYEDYAELERRLLATEAQKPVAWTEKCEITNMQATGLYLRGFPDNSQGRDIPLYAAAPLLKVPDAEPSSEAMKRALEAFYEGCHALEEKAMLAAFKILLADVREHAAQPVAGAGKGDVYE
ncbi:hypothetical protein ICL29_004070 [Salmonella enterica]|nr:hypothetical protein [Salmonella enterica]EHK5999346.1 hypothetical protein [Salmonella enterica]EIF5124565.1 hypothetical protein [Salmonella enterica]EIF5348741.1 hypothetical protein [Salmonella enterica]EIF5657338.1 hypothetical protein [Salmonella enterica]